MLVKEKEMNCRRARSAGGTYFLTVNSAKRRVTLLTDTIKNLRASLMFTKNATP
jgi:REP element-mobilizing transposase RayT